MKSEDDDDQVDAFRYMIHALHAGPVIAKPRMNVTIDNIGDANRYKSGVAKMMDDFHNHGPKEMTPEEIIAEEIAELG